MTNVLDAAETEFILMMGDDDELHVSPKDRPLDLASLDPSFMGVRPLTAVSNSEGRIVRVKDFGILDERPGQRVMTYNGHAKGDNAAYYSIFRRAPFVDLHRFFIEHHPVKGGFADWALACVLFSYGKMAYDPGTIFRYNAHQWDRRDKIDGQMRTLYAAAGLPENSDHFALLLLYLDMLIMALRRGTPLDEAGKRDLVVNAGVPILAGFCRKVLAEPGAYDERTAHLARMVLDERNANSQFSLALLLADGLTAGLKDRYQAFYQKAMAA
jgi:hypothetical protein